MSTVYLAVQFSVGREVALKVMSPVLNADPVFSQRFQREANIVGQLSHPNIVSIYDIGCHASLNYITMDYLPGGTVHERMRSGMSTAEILRVIREIARALDLVHAKGYVHRDIKPENILFREDGAAVLTDFGVAKSLRIASSLGNAGTVVGTPHYMSPEQSRGLPIDGRSDIYSLGIVFYEMLTGVVPYQGDEAVVIAIKHLTARIPALPGQYAVYQGLLNRLLAKTADDRFQSGADIVEALNILEETLAGYPGRQKPFTDVSDMNIMALFKALLLASVAVLRIKLGQLAAVLGSWRWTPKRGFFRHRPIKVTAMRTEVDTAENQRATVVSPQIKHSADYQKMSSRKAGLVIRGFGLLFTLPIVWGAISVGLVRFDMPTARYLPAGLHNAISSTASVVDSYAERFKSAAKMIGEGGIATVSAQSSRASTRAEGETNKLARAKDPLESSAAAHSKTSVNSEQASAPRYALTVIPEPKDAVVRVLNIREKYSDDIQLQAGRYHLEVSRPGFISIKNWIRIGEEDLTVNYRLEPLHLPGDLIADPLGGNGGTGPELVVIAPGRFTMGQQGQAHLSPEREVQITRQFAAGKYEITFADYEKFSQATGATPPNDKRWGKGSRPVINVSWPDALAYIRWLSETTGESYRLPTEAEWEYFARAGSSGDNWWGDENASGKANCKRGCDSDYTGLFSSKTAPVGSFPANPFGLHDTAGNVAEWVLDCYENHYVGAPTDGSAVAAEGCTKRPVRGGAASDGYRSLFSYERQKIDANTKSQMIGFRVVRELAH